MQIYTNKKSPRKIWKRLNMVESPFWQKAGLLGVMLLLIAIPSVLAVNYFLGMTITMNTVNPIVTSSGNVNLNGLVPNQEVLVNFQMNNTNAQPQNVTIFYNETSNSGMSYTTDYNSTKITLAGNSVNDQPFKFKVKFDTGFGNATGQIGWAFAE